MQTIDYKILEIKAYEAFIRRASQVNLPFMLKGSYVTRQYFQNPNDRFPVDLDWVYMGIIKDESTARQIFNEWAILVTEFELDDNIKFRSFRENEFWRRIDYAMSDDFPTINTDLTCLINGNTVRVYIDISFNLDIEEPPVPLMYHPLEGEPFLIPSTVPISLQVSWKIHQTLVRPRFKDLFDLMHLVQHPTFDKNVLGKSLQALVNECRVDKIDLIKLKHFLNYEIEELFRDTYWSKMDIHKFWSDWRHRSQKNILYANDNSDARAYSTDISKLPNELEDFLKKFKSILENAGFDIHLFDNLPEPTRSNRRTFDRRIFTTTTDNTTQSNTTITNNIAQHDIVIDSNIAQPDINILPKSTNSKRESFGKMEVKQILFLILIILYFIRLLWACGF